MRTQSTQHWSTPKTVRKGSGCFMAMVGAGAKSGRTGKRCWAAIFEKGTPAEGGASARAQRALSFCHPDHCELFGVAGL